MRRRLRRQLRTTVVAIVVACGLGIGFLHDADLDPLTPFGADLDGARRSLTYLHGPASDWLVFPIQPGRDALRIATTANIDARALALLEAPLSADYAFEYQLVPADGSPPEAPRRYHETAILDPLAPRRGFYLVDDIVPASTQIARIDIADRRIRELRVRIVSPAPEIRDIGIRAYIEEPVSEREIGYRWQRLTREQQARLLDGSVYPPEFARRAEREVASSMRWMPLGPGGIAGADYDSRPLYLREEEDGDTAWRAIATPPGVLSDPDGRAVVTIPPEGGRVRLHFEAADPRDTRPRIAAIEWVPDRPGRPRRWRVDLQNGSGVFEQELASGSLVLTTGTGVAVRAELASEDGLTDITPSPTLATLWRGAPGAPFVFPLTQTPGDGLPVRVDLRPLRERGAPAEPRSAEIRMLAADGTVVARDSMVAQFRDAPFERERIDTGHVAGEAERAYFHVPPNVTQLEIDADPLAAVSVHVRPPGLAHLTRVPIDYRAHDLAPPRPSVWYGLLPRDREPLLRSDRRLLLQIAPEPTATDPDMLAGRYDFDTLEPEGGVLARELLLPRAGSARVRPSALASWFRPVPQDTATELRFEADPLTGDPEPALLWYAPEARRGALSVRIDGREVLSATIAGRMGRVRLPPLEAGTHRLELTAPEGVRLVINQAGRARDQVNFLQRLARRVPDDGRLVYVVDKQDTQQTLTFALHRPIDEGAPADIEVRIDGIERPTRSNAWTIAHRRYQIQASQADAALVLGGSAAVDAGESFFVTLNEDLAPGRYRIALQIDAARGSYLTAYTIRPGEATRERFSLERTAGITRQDREQDAWTSQATVEIDVAQRGTAACGGSCSR